MARVKRGNVARKRRNKTCGWPVASVVAMEPCSAPPTNA